MQVKWFISMVSIGWLALVGCEEKNPYVDGEVARSGSPQAANTNNQSAAPRNQPEQSQVDTTAVEDTQEVLDEEVADAETLTTGQAICGSEGMFGNHAEEFAVVCLNGQPNTAFANALAGAYAGAGEATPTLIKSIDNNGVSQFVLIAAIKVAQTVDEVVAEQAVLNESDFTEGNASVTQTVLSDTAVNQNEILSRAEIQFDLRVSVGIINVNDTRMLTKELIEINPELGIKGYRTTLTAGAAENEDNIIANQISFFVPNEDGGSTLIVISHQQADNRNQHQTAETTFVSLARRTMVDGYNHFAGL